LVTNQDVVVGQLADLVAITLRNFSISRQSAELGLIETLPNNRSLSSHVIHKTYLPKSRRQRLRSPSGKNSQAKASIFV
jgi:hypothetical protein